VKSTGSFYTISPTGALIPLPIYAFRSFRLPRLFFAEPGNARPDISPLSEAIRLISDIRAHSWEVAVEFVFMVPIISAAEML
jgi:hypothetical protein